MSEKYEAPVDKELRPYNWHEIFAIIFMVGGIILALTDAPASVATSFAVVALGFILHILVRIGTRLANAK